LKNNCDTQPTAGRPKPHWVQPSQAIPGTGGPGFSVIFEVLGCEGLGPALWASHTSSLLGITLLARTRGSDIKDRLFIYIRLCSNVCHDHTRNLPHPTLETEAADSCPQGNVSPKSTDRCGGHPHWPERPWPMVSGSILSATSQILELGLAPRILGVARL
jgi:hypothetical protein